MKITMTPTGSSIVDSGSGGQVSFTGAASVHAALADQTFDAYVDIPRNDLRPNATSDRYTDAKLRALVSFDTPTPESGAVLKSISFRANAARVAGTGTPNPPSRGLSVARENGQRQTIPAGNVVSELAYTPRNTSIAPANPQLTLRGIEYQLPKKVPGNSDYETQKAYDVANRTVRVYQLFYDYTYVKQPTVTVTQPADSSTVSTASAPQIQWAVRNLDTDGGDPIKYRVKIFNASQYGAGGFNPASSSAVWDSGALSGYVTSIKPSVNLPDTNYRAYVIVAVDVNGVDLWSSYTDAYTSFTVSASRPTTPINLTATADNANGRITLSAQKQSGAATTDYIEFQRRLFGETSDDAWENIRTADGDGRVPATTATTTTHDYETGNGVEYEYRCRAVKDYAEEIGDAVSPYTSASDEVAWTGTTWWLKAPTRPSMNLVVYIDALSTENRAARQGVFQPIGADKPIVVSDTRETKTGEVTFRVDTDEEKIALNDLIELGEPLFLQGVPTHHWDDKYLMLGDYARVRTPDKAFVETTLDSTTWVEVDSPTMNIGE